jgi:hypothetical protein
MEDKISAREDICLGTFNSSSQVTWVLFRQGFELLHMGVSDKSVNKKSAREDLNKVETQI